MCKCVVKKSLYLLTIPLFNAHRENQSLVFILSASTDRLLGESKGRYTLCLGSLKQRSKRNVDLHNTLKSGKLIGLRVREIGVKMGKMPIRRKVRELTKGSNS